MDQYTAPGLDSLLDALRLIGRTADGLPLELTAEERMLAEPALIVGMLDAAVHELAQKYCTGVGRGGSQRFKVVIGYKRYLDRPGASPDELMSFFQDRLARLASDMRTGLNSHHL